MRFQSCLRFSTQLLNRRYYVFDLAKLNMSANKRAGESLNHSGPSKLQRNVDNNNFIQRTLSMSSLLSNKSNSSEMESVEVLEVPYKSENDKKSYRVIRLNNSLKALLISDPTQQCTSNSDDIKHHQAAAASDDEEVEEDGDDAEDETSGSENSDDEAKNKNKHQKRGKLAACSLCVDVGSFSDPRDIQGLAHFLGKINAFFLHFQ